MISIPPQDAIELPVDQLALIVLKDLVASGERNEYNHGNRHRQDVQGGYARNIPALQAISEAMAWLRARGMVAPRAEDSNPDSIFVARWGHEALSKSLTEIHA